MPTDFSTIDMATLNAAQSVMVAALRDCSCHWEQDSASLYWSNPLPHFNHTTQQQ